MSQTAALTIQRLRGATIFKLILLGNTIGAAVLMSVLGIFTLFGTEIIQWDGQYLTGMRGLLLSPLIGTVLGFIFGLFTALFTYVGLRLFARFKLFTIEYVPANSNPRMAIMK